MDTEKNQREPIYAYAIKRGGAYELVENLKFPGGILVFRTEEQAEEDFRKFVAKFDWNNLEHILVNIESLVRSEIIPKDKLAFGATGCYDPDELTDEDYKPENAD